MRKKIVILGGGTVNHVRNHLALCAPAYGTTARQLKDLVTTELDEADLLWDEYEVQLVLTKMADASSPLETNKDVSEYVDTLIADSSVRAIVFNVALADYEGVIDNQPSGKHAERLKTSEGEQVMKLIPAEKILGRVRKERKDIFLVGFKTTTNHSSQAQYTRGLELMKKNSVNLVLANDTTTRNNMIIAPEETRYCETTDRGEVLAFLAKMMVSRMQNHFTRSTVVPGNAVPWQDTEVPSALRQVVDHCIEQGAYKPVLGKTAGHFAVRAKNGAILTSIRKTNFNDLAKTGLVLVESKNDDEVIAHGFRPSVGGQSQRIIFREHPDLDCIVHFHCPVREDAPDKAAIPVTPQWPNECGSHECGRNTSRNLRKVDLGNQDELAVVFLDNHGPNIVFNRKTPAQKVIEFIERNFDLSQKTGGLLAA